MGPPLTVTRKMMILATLARRGLPPRFGLPRAAPPRAICRSGFDELKNDAVRIPEAAELEVAEAREVQRLRGREKRHALVL